MPIKIPDNLPAAGVLNSENIFIMPEDRAFHQDIRALKIAILNLMPDKITTETQLLRLIGNSPLQVEISLVQTRSYTSKNTPMEHLLNFYCTFEEIKHQKFDGLIITGAPVEKMEFEQVDYWDELTEIMEWSKHNVYSTFHICWGAQAGLYYHYGVQKHALEKKMFGVFEHTISSHETQLTRGFDDLFQAPHSRHTSIDRKLIQRCEELEIVAESELSGVYIVTSKNYRQVFVTGHSEYDQFTLRNEYQRDVDAGLPIELPYHYFSNDDPASTPPVTWRGHANLLFSNWLNYYVYQVTPYNRDMID